MQLVRQEEWTSFVENNTDEYGAAVVRYAERWADLMEKRLSEGRALADIGESASQDADTEGITGFMCGCAVAMLSRVWVHGEELRQRHNLSTQLDSEGERANENGGVLNPALLNIGLTKEG